MATLSDVFEELNALRNDGIVGDYALGGATAVLFYAEPTRTYDLDVFVILPDAQSELLTSLRPLDEWARRRGRAS